MDRRVAARQSISVIPGRAEGANLESRNTDRACVWIPGPALMRRPGMTGEVSRHKAGHDGKPTALRSFRVRRSDWQ